MTARLLITAGPTHEPIDAVRYLGNRSSGRLGIGLAEAADARGWDTMLLLGPTMLPPPSGSGVTVQRFRTTADLQSALDDAWPRSDILIMAAAVADYRPVCGGSDGKLRRTDRRLSIELEPTPDLLAGLAETTRPDQTVIGFALEPAADLMASARDKLRRKRLDAIVANPLETMDATTISAHLLEADGAVTEAPPDLPKAAFAAWLLDEIVRIRQTRAATGPAS